MRKQLVALTAFAVGLGLAAPAGALTYTAVDQNSTLSFDDATGFYSWRVDGVDHLFREDYRARVGGGAAALLTPTSVVLAGNQLTMSYTIAGWGSLRMSHNLFGGALGSNSAGWSSSLGFTAINPTGSLNFYMYDDFDIGQTFGGDSVANPFSGIYLQTDPTSPGELNRWASSSAPNFCQAGFIGVTSPNFNANLLGGCTAGVGDVWFANQWTDPAQFSVDRSIVRTPEPGTLMLFGFGLLGLGAAARRKV